MTDYDIGQAFARIEDELIASMMRNMNRHKREESAYGFNWTAWQTEQLKALEKYRVANKEKFQDDFVKINRSISELITQARQEGGMKAEIRILKSIQKGYKIQGKNKTVKRKNQKFTADFFQSNNRKMDALIRATTHDFKKAETAMLRMADDQYRKIIFKAQVYANSGAGTYKQAVDMAAKDFLSAGINCIEYKNGARHTMKDYSQMAIRTANKRAALTGAGEKRNEYGIRTVIVNSRAGACEKCLPFVGVVFIDDVWSGGTRKDGDYPLLSTAISAGLFHPNCKDGLSTYYPGISSLQSKYTKDEIEQIAKDTKRENKWKYAAAQAEKFGRMAKYSLDEENKKHYSYKEKKWEEYVDNSSESGILKTSNSKEDIDMATINTLGKIDIEILSKEFGEIQTDEIIVTGERLSHIKERHPEDYELFQKYGKESLVNPDLIIKDGKHDGTVFMVKKLPGTNLNVVVRVALATDKPGHKNSVMTFYRLRERNLKKEIQKNRLLYKRE